MRLPPRPEGTFPLLGLLLALAALAGALPSPARAYEEQLLLAVGAGYGWAPDLPAPDHGPTAQLGVEVGLDSTWGIQGTATYAVHPPFQGGEAFHLGLVGAEVTYVFDVLQIVPRLGLGADLVLAGGGGGGLTLDGAAHLLVAVDYLVTREIVVGLDLRPYLRFAEIVEGTPFYLAAWLRLGVLLPL